MYIKKTKPKPKTQIATTLGKGQFANSFLEEVDGLNMWKTQEGEEKAEKRNPSAHLTPMDHPVVGHQNVDFFEDQTLPSKIGKCIWKHFELVWYQGRTIIHSRGPEGRGSQGELWV